MVLADTCDNTKFYDQCEYCENEVSVNDVFEDIGRGTPMTTQKLS